ncbi:MAG: hypothetical protein KDA65_07680 [Planctomycetaceae bacterium]|nr:hypothetical protein [Planctomycetaceae bacterium]
MTSTRQIIEDYVNGVQHHVQLICEHYGVEDLWNNRRENVPNQAVIDLPGKRISFTFHGIGCEIRVGEKIFDFDFGPEGRLGGFDAWRLSRLVDSSREYNSNEFTLEKLQADIDHLVEIDEVEMPRLDPSRHLYYLKTKQQDISNSPPEELAKAQKSYTKNRDKLTKRGNFLYSGTYFLSMAVGFLLHYCLRGEKLTLFNYEEKTIWYIFGATPAVPCFLFLGCWIVSSEKLQKKYLSESYRQNTSRNIVIELCVIFPLISAILPLLLLWSFWW